jgi:hypothetical protein
MAIKFRSATECRDGSILLKKSPVETVKAH